MAKKKPTKTPDSNRKISKGKRDDLNNMERTGSREVKKQIKRTKKRYPS